MKGDFTRFTFDPKRHYKGVLMQQGRVILDADWNEQVGIIEHIRETEVRDIIGECGTPINCEGFEVDVAPGGRDLILSSGRIYVDGILCELDGGTEYFGDPSFEISEGRTLLTISEECEMDLKKEQWVKISARIDSDIISDIRPERPLIEERVMRQVLRIVDVQKDPDSNKIALTLDGTVNEGLINAAKSNGISIKIFFRIETGQSMSNESSGRFLAYLDVWNRHITAVEDDSIREKALKGPDTSTRIKTEWGVKLAPYNLESIPRSIRGSIPEKISCHQAALILKDLLEPAPSRLAVRLHAAQEGATDISAKDPCLALSGASYRGLENQLYRVEIHQPGVVGEATFKWSRYNGAIAFAIEDFIPDVSAESSASKAETPAKFHRVKLSRLGWDETLRIHVDDLVEVSGDETELQGKPGTLARVMKIEEADMMLTLSADVALHAKEANPKIRRWDMDKGKMKESPSIEGMPTGAISGKSSWIEIEKGIEVRFKEGDQYQTGDFWLIPARDSGKIEWPYAEDDFVSKFGIQHHGCLLAILSLGADGTWKLERDCRKLFTPLSDMLFLSYVGGDGQEAMPGDWLPAPFEVRVTRGDQPIKGVQIAFEILEGQAVLEPANGSVLTDVEGIARCKCQITKNPSQDNFNIRVRARLLCDTTAEEIGNQSCTWIVFNANASVAAQVAYDPLKECRQLMGASTVKEAIDGLCRQVSFSYAGGDGQEAIAGKKLAEPFRVRVARGSYPVKNAVVNFKIDSGKGLLESDREVGTDLDIETDLNGIAACYCTPKEDATIRAMLKMTDPPSGNTAPIIWFNADVINAEQVAYNPVDCRQLEGVSTVKEAIDGLCRLSDQVSLTYVGGDGQEAIPGNVLSVPFAVRVSRGSYPVKDALVGFEIVEGAGELRKSKDGREQISQRKLEIKADENGIAECFFKLEKDVDKSAVVMAKLIDPRPVDGSYIRFSVGVSSADNTGYVPSEECIKLKDAKTVKQAIDILCSQSPSTEKSLTTWVHGNSLHLQIIREEREKDITLRYDDTNGQVAVVKGEKGSLAKICFSIPVTMDPNNTLPVAVSAVLRARANEELNGEIYISDGETTFFKADKITIKKRWENIRFALGDKPISFGISITMIINFVSPNEISFSAAGCTIQSNF